MAQLTSWFEVIFIVAVICGIWKWQILVVALAAAAAVFASRYLAQTAALPIRLVGGAPADPADPVVPWDREEKPLDEPSDDFWTREKMLTRSNRQPSLAELHNHYDESTSVTPNYARPLAVLPRPF